MERKEEKIIEENHLQKLTVLVVDDEVLVRMGAVTMIQDAGFAVIEASDADEAIRILESRNDIRIVFTDVNMPGSMNGLKLAHAVRSRWPPIQLIVVSGLQMVSEEELPAGACFFSKPYRYSDIARTLRELTA